MTRDVGFVPPEPVDVRIVFRARPLPNWVNRLISRLLLAPVLWLRHRGNPPPARGPDHAAKKE